MKRGSLCSVRKEHAFVDNLFNSEQYEFLRWSERPGSVKDRCYITPSDVWAVERAARGVTCGVNERDVRMNFHLLPC